MADPARSPSTRSAPADPCGPPPLLPWWLRRPTRRLCWGLLVLLLVAMAWLAFTPAPPRRLDSGLDKINHTLGFLALALVAELAAWPWPRHRLRAALALLAYGLCIELVQSQLPTRSAEWGDVLADAAGIALGLLLAAPLLAPLRPPRGRCRRAFRPVPRAPAGPAPPRGRTPTAARGAGLRSGRTR